MQRNEVMTMFSILGSSLIAFGLPIVLRSIQENMDIKRFKRLISIITTLYFSGIVFFAFIFRSQKINGTGVILDFFWGYRRVIKQILVGYNNGGIIEAIHRIRWVRDTVANMILNIIFFIPLGYLLPLIAKKTYKWWALLGVGIIISLCIEIMQYLTCLGWFDVSDPVYNGLGVMIGYHLYQKAFKKHISNSEYDAE